MEVINKIKQPFWDSIAKRMKGIQDIFESIGISDAKEIGTIIGIIMRRPEKVSSLKLWKCPECKALWETDDATLTNEDLQCPHCEVQLLEEW